MICVPCPVCITAYGSFIILFILGIRKIKIKIKDKDLSSWI